MATQFTYFIQGFASRYQDILNKILVSAQVANRRLETNMSFGVRFSRFILDLSGVRVRSESMYSNRSVDAMADSTEYIDVDQQKYMGTKMHKWDKIQIGPLKAGEEAGRQLAKKLKAYVDADVLAQVAYAYDTFDDGDIGGTDGAPVDYTVTNVPKIESTILAKLQANNIDTESNNCRVYDPYTLAMINQTLIGKDIDLAGATFKNGYTGTVLGSDMLVSNNLTFKAKLTLGANPTNGDTIVIGGVTFTFVTTIGAVAGNVLCDTSAAATIDNLVTLITDPATTTATGVALSTANIKKIRDTYRSACADGTTYATFTFTGAGRLVLSETFTSASNGWDLMRIHSYAGRKKQIDLIMQQDVEPDLREEPLQPTTNIFVDALYGLKTFADASQNFLDVWVKTQAKSF